jgi:hypothetical protein
MSHVAQMELAITDLDCLEAAAKDLGLELARGQQTYRWWGHSVGDYPLPAGFKEEDLGKCEHAIRVPGDNRAYEIGVVPRRDGKQGYTLLWDFYGGGYGMEAKVGKNGDRLKQAYNVQVATKDAIRNHKRVIKTQREDGHVVLRLVR